MTHRNWFLSRHLLWIYRCLCWKILFVSILKRWIRMWCKLTWQVNVTLRHIKYNWMITSSNYTKQKGKRDISVAQNARRSRRLWVGSYIKSPVNINPVLKNKILLQIISALTRKFFQENHAVVMILESIFLSLAGGVLHVQKFLLGEISPMVKSLWNKTNYV